jgi:hypothetical protein
MFLVLGAGKSDRRARVSPGGNCAGSQLHARRHRAEVAAREINFPEQKARALPAAAPANENE